MELTQKQKVRRLAESAIMLALATVLSMIEVFKLPQGGGVTLFSQVPIIIIAYRYGTKWGLFTGLAMGVIQMLFGLENFAWVSGIVAYIILVLADYIIAFGALGLGGMFKKVVKNQAVALGLGAAVASIIRFACHFISGVTIWKEYAEGYDSVWLYSLVYNGSYMAVELAITVVGAMLIGLIFDLSSPELKILKKSK